MLFTSVSWHLYNKSNLPIKHNSMLNRQPRKIIYGLTQYVKKEIDEGVIDVQLVCPNAQFSGSQLKATFKA